MVLRPLRAIREKCLDCCAGNRAEVKRCPVEKCTLHPYRMGHRPTGYTDAPEEETVVNTPENPHFPTAEAKKESPLV